MTESLIQNTTRSESQIQKPRRRQFSSCDQCRKGKRGCDILVPGDVVHSNLSPCSNCSKTGKLCTTEWLKSRDQAPYAKRPPSLGSSPTVATKPAKQTENKIWDLDWNQIEKPVAPLPDVWALPLSPASYIYQQNFEFEDNSQAGSTDRGTILEVDSRQFANNGLRASGPDPRTFPSTQSSIQLSSISTIASSLSWPNELEVQYETPISEECEQTPQIQQNYIGRKKRRYSMPASCFNSGQKAQARTSNRRTSFQSSRPPSGSDPSSASLDYRLAFSANKSFISGNLLKIYHDSMENALTCWLTEKTCPYDMEIQPHARGRIRRKAQTEELNPHWSNRICERVCKLDKACGILRGRILTSSENRAVDMALRKSIMSFATQWSYSSGRVLFFFSFRADTNYSKLILTGL